MVSKRWVLHFPPRLVDQPVVSRLVREYDLGVNILKAFISPGEEGVMVLELWGEREQYDRGIEYLTKIGVRFQPLSQDVRRDESKCIQCGACTAVCPTGALAVNPVNRSVDFVVEKCVACARCVQACPFRAMAVQF